MRNLLFTIVMWTCAVAMWAVPAWRVQRVINVDGNEVAVTLVGDEKLHYWLAADGTAYRETPDGNYEAMDIAAEQRRVKARRMALPRKTSSHVDPIIGEKKGLVILVNTPDLQFSCSDDPNALFYAMMNEPGFHHGTATGSVRDYFRDQSYGKLDYSFDVVGPVTVSLNMAHYGGNPQYDWESVAVCEMVAEAVKLADEQVNYKDYDVDGDGEVENVYIIYAGYSAAAGAPEWTIWPHAWRISYANYWNPAVNAPRCDGVKIDSYACSSEFRGTKGKNIDAIGTICHEFSHCLGLPDFYSTVNTHNDYTNGYWSLLDTGTYSNDGDTPCSYTAYERWFCGWLEPVELRNDTIIKGLGNIDESQKAYVYYNEANHNEFYILHNIQKKGWNAYAYGHGLAVFHVDVDDYAWAYDEVNNYPDHLRMRLLCADNIYSWDSVWEDLYPNSSGNNKLNDSSKPSCKVFSLNVDDTYSMGKYLTSIREDAKGEISFRFTMSQRLKNVTGIEDAVAGRGTSGPRYNLNGQRVDDSYRGIVVTSEGKMLKR